MTVSLPEVASLPVTTGRFLVSLRLDHLFIRHSQVTAITPSIELRVTFDRSVSDRSHLWQAITKSSAVHVELTADTPLPGFYEICSRSIQGTTDSFTDHLHLTTNQQTARAVQSETGKEVHRTSSYQLTHSPVHIAALLMRHGAAEGRVRILTENRFLRTLRYEKV